MTNRTLKDLSHHVSQCVECGLSESRTQVVFGSGNPNADYFFIGEGPGAKEDLEGEPFIGRSGKLLSCLIGEELKIDRSQCYIANVVKCRPPNNRNPKSIEISTCKPYLDEQIQLVNPVVIIPLGNFASRLLLNTKEGITNLRGERYSYKQHYLVPTFHPAAALRGNPDALKNMRLDFQLAYSIVSGNLK